MVYLRIKSQAYMNLLKPLLFLYYIHERYIILILQEVTILHELYNFCKMIFSNSKNVTLNIHSVYKDYRSFM